MITRIFADNYRCLQNFTFEPKRLNLLVGDNGSGKSSLIKLVGSLRLLVSTSDALKYAFAGSLTRWSDRPEQHLDSRARTRRGPGFTGRL